MGNCCDTSSLVKQRKNILTVVLILNLLMFFVQFFSAIIGHSTSLLADSFDMLGDALAYSISLYALNKSTQWHAGAALFKGIVILLFSFGVIAEVTIKMIWIHVFPNVSIMVIFSMASLIINSVCFYLLSQHRAADINLYSTWVCARNDIIGNIAVLLTACLVFSFNSRWPDIIIGLLFSLVLLKSAWRIIFEARKEISAIRDQVKQNHKVVHNV